MLRLGTSSMLRKRTPISKRNSSHANTTSLKKPNGVSMISASSHNALIVNEDLKMVEASSNIDPALKATVVTPQNDPSKTLNFIQ